MPPETGQAHPQAEASELAQLLQHVPTHDMLIHILHLEDDPAEAEFIRTMVESGDDPLHATISVVCDEKSFLEALRAGSTDLILCDYRLAGYDGELALKAAKEICPNVPVIMVTGEMGEERAIETLKAGAVDYVIKDRLQRLVPSIRRALKDAVMERERREGEEKYRVLVETSQDGILINQGGCIKYVNPAAVRLLGAESSHELIGRSIFDFFHSDYHAVINQRLQQIMQTGTPAPPLEEKIVKVDGTIAEVEVTAGQITLKGEAAFQVVLRDITRRKRAEEALRKSELIYRAVGETIDYGIWICDPSGRNTYASPSLLKLVGMTQEQCSEFGWGNYLHPDDAAGTIAAWQQCAAAGTFWEREHRFRDVMGRYHHILARGIPIRDGDGAIICWAGINLDIDELKRKEEALRLSKEEFSAAFEGSPYPQSISRVADGTFVDVNSAYLAFYSMTREEIIGKTSRELGIIVVPEEREELVRLLRRDGAVHRFEMHVMSRSQGERLVLLAASLLKGRVEPTMLIMFTDITDRKKVDTALRESEERFRIMVDSTPVLIWLTNDRGENTLVNNAYENFFGVTEAQVKPPYTWQVLVHPEDKERYTNAFLKAVQTQSAFEAEARVRGKNGEWCWLRSSAVPRFGSDGTFLGHVGSSTDITSLKLIEDARRKDAENLRVMVEAAIEPMMVIGAEGEIESVSRASALVLGFQSGELVGRNVTELIEPMSRLEVTLRLDDLRKHAPQPVSATVRARTKSGASQWFTVDASMTKVGRTEEKYLIKFKKLTIDIPQSQAGKEPLLPL